MKVLLADDDRDLVDLLRYTFQRAGYSVVTAFDGEMALRALKAEAPDLVVLDLMMPKRNGMEVLKDARRDGDVPIIVLTGLGDEDHVVSALELGADDYLVKPFRPRELRARAQSLLRRSTSDSTSQPKMALPLALGDIKLDPNAREVSVAGAATQLTRTEFDLLHYLMRNREVVLSASDIIAAVWGYEADENDEVVKVAISRLRRKIEHDPSNPRYIVTVHGVGYKFQSKETDM
ncbi:MAG: response regulator transcription factor [Chloroflexi bacterium]|nr:response regulator transcription factor [Chloroflexota bacterium]